MIRNEWIKTLKIGDQVCYNNSPSFSKERSYVVTKVKKITPTGRVTLEDDTQFDNTGCKGSNSSICFLEPITQEIAVYIKRKRMINKVKQMKIDDLTNEQLIQIIDIIKII